MKKPVVLSLGSVNADFQVRIDRRPDVGETLPARDFLRLGGGKAANVAFLARRLGVETRLLARVGDDDLREQALGPLREAGVDLDGVTTAAGCATGVAMITVPPDGNKGIILAANANDTWTDAEARNVVSAIEQAPEGSVLVADYEVPAFVVRKAVEAAAARGIAAVIDPSPADRVEKQTLGRATAVTPNASEAKLLTGIAVEDTDTAVEAASRLADLGVRIVCMKLPDGGCLVAADGRLTVVPAMPVEVVDTTGAGDAFAGAFAVALVEQRPVTEAACFAVAASHLAVTAYGSQPSYPDRDRIDAMFHSMIDKVHDLGSQ